MFVKFCGMTRRIDVEAAEACGANAVGLIFAPSPRKVTIEQARRMLNEIEILKVGVFVNETPETVLAVRERCGLDIIQLHGDESPEYCEQIGGTIFKAIRLKDDVSLSLARQYPKEIKLLLDAYKKGQAGGTGKRIDYALLDKIDDFSRVIIAGGVGADNVEAIVRRYHPFGVDINSRIETAPGIKDHRLMRLLIELVKKRTYMRKKGYFGKYGGQFVPELLMPALNELEKGFHEIGQREDFKNELDALLRNYAGRPTPLYYAKRFTEQIGGARILLKREDLNHTGSHKLNNCLGQALLAKKMGKGNIITETGAGQHGVATATVCALMGLKCKIYMGEEDIKRQQLNVFRMRLLGSEVVPVRSGTRTLKDATSEAMRAWISTVKNTQYLLGSVVGPHPFPLMVRHFQSVIGNEARRQIKEYGITDPDVIIACVGGGSNAIGIFHPFKDTKAKMVGVEAGGRGTFPGENAASISFGTVGVFHGKKSYFLQDENGQIIPAHSIAAGLDYPGVGPEHAHYADSGRAEYRTVTDDEAVEAFRLLSRTEGIIPALESAHAIAYAMKIAAVMPKDKTILVNLSGRGDKDTSTLQVKDS